MTYRWLPVLVLLLLTPAALAHDGLAHGAGLLFGFWHPLDGDDHIIAMLAVGLLASAYGGHALWGLPLLNVAALIGGALIGGYALPLALLQFGAVAIVVLLGLMLAYADMRSALTAALLVTLLGMFSGYIHIDGAAATAARLDYGVGFVLATLLLQLVGIAGGFVAQWSAPVLLRVFGLGVVALSLGAALLS